MDKKILNLNGTVLRNTEDIWDKDGGRTWSLISVRDGGYLTIKGNGSVIAKENDCYAVDVRGGAHLINITSGSGRCVSCRRKGYQPHKGNHRPWGASLGNWRCLLALRWLL